MQKKIMDNISSLLLALILCLSFVYALTSALGIGIPVSSIIIIAAVFLTVFSLVFLSRLSMLISGIITFIILMYFVFIIAFNTGLDPLLEFAYNYFIWLYDIMVYGTYPDALYTNITFIALCFLTCLYHYIFTCKKYIFLLAITPGVAVFASQSILAYTATYVPFYIFLLSLILCYFKHIHNKKVRNSGNDYLENAPFMLWIIPIAAIVVMSAALVHASEKPLEWKWLDTKVTAAYNYFSKKFDYVELDYFSISESGFGDKNSILGGRVKLNKTLVLTVETDKRVYLKGTAYDKYTGRNWLNTGEEIQEDVKTGQINFDTNEMIMGMDILVDYFYQYFDNAKVKIVYQNIKTKSIFLPPKFLSVEPAKKDSTFMTNTLNDTLASTKRLGSGFSYDSEFLVPKRTNEDFINAMRRSRQGIYDNLSSNLSVSNDIYEYLKDYSARIYSKFLEVPETVPQRVFDLASSLTVQYDNNYDKVKALEKYLAENYPYNLNVRSTPRNRDFVDYFLFEQKEGYCTYYATALTIMARCIGIPARYVEGYVLPPKPTEKNQNLYYVTNNQAHAWTEVYFEGYGWLSFESTSPFRSEFYSDPVVSSVISGSLMSDPSYMDYMEMMKNYSGEMDSSVLDIVDYEIKKPPYLLYAAIAVGALILFILLILSNSFIRRKLKLYKLMNLSPKECVLNLYKYFVTVLALSGCGIQAGETPSQYCERIDRYFYFRPITFKEVTDIFVRARYSPDKTSEKEKQVLIDFIPLLLAESKNDIGRTKNFIYRNALGKF